MSVQLPSLWKHRPFQIAWVWEALCIVASVFVLLKTDSTPAMIGVILLGAAPMVFVTTRFSLTKHKAAANPAPAADRSKDIVQ